MVDRVTPVTIPAPNPGRRPAGLVPAAMMVAGLAALVVLERWHTYAEPPERDIAGYALIAHEMMRGQHLYADLWDRKPPLLYLSFAAAERLVGYGPGEIFAVNVAASLVTLAGCYAIGRAGGGGDRGGLVAALLWVLLGSDLPLQANQPNCEVFVNAAMTVGVAVLAHWPTRRVRPCWGRAMAAGGAFAAATLYKQHTVVMCVAVAAGHIGVARDRRRTAVTEMAAASAVVAAAWSVVAGYFLVVGRFGSAVELMGQQSAVYAGSPYKAIADFFSPGALDNGLGGWTVGPIVLVGAWALSAASGRRLTRRWWLWLAWAIGALLASALPAHLFLHYYQYELPVACVAGGWSAAGLLGRPGRPAHFARTATALIGVGLVLWREVPNYRLSADQWSRAKRAGDYVDQRDLALRLAGLLRPGERFWDDGEDATFYFVARQSPISGLLWPDPMVVGRPDQVRAYRDRLWSAVSAAKPDAVLIWQRRVKYARMPDPRIAQWLRQSYVDVKPLAVGFPDWIVAVRRDSDVYRRVTRGLPPAATRPVAVPPD